MMTACGQGFGDYDDEEHRKRCIRCSASYARELRQELRQEALQPLVDFVKRAIGRLSRWLKR